MEESQTNPKADGLSKALQDGAKCFGSVQQNNRHQVIVPTQTTAIIITGEVTTWEDHLMETKEPKIRRNQGQRHSEGDRKNQWRLIEENTVPLLRKVSVICKKIVRKVGLMSKMWESRTSSKKL